VERQHLFKKEERKLFKRSPFTCADNRASASAAPFSAAYFFFDSSLI
jgi:hypothetical protein